MNDPSAKTKATGQTVLHSIADSVKAFPCRSKAFVGSKKQNGCNGEYESVSSNVDEGGKQAFYKQKDAYDCKYDEREGALTFPTRFRNSRQSLHVHKREDDIGRNGCEQKRKEESNIGCWQDASSSVGCNDCRNAVWWHYHAYERSTYNDGRGLFGICSIGFEIVPNDSSRCKDGCHGETGQCGWKRNEQ